MGTSCAGDPAPPETAGSSEESHPVETLKLSDFKPVSRYQMPATRVEKARFPAIDLHAHPYVDNEAELDEWVQIMDEVGLDKSVVMTYATGARFDTLARLFSKYPDRFILFCGFDYTGFEDPGFGPAAVAELERCVQAGARGVGELGDKGKGLFYSKPTPAYGMHIDDPRMKPLIEKCGELGIPISIHVAEPIWMYDDMNAQNDGLMNAFKWRLDNQEGILGHGETVQTLDNAVKANPNTTFIACHYANCSYDLSILGGMFDRYPNLYADIGARYAETAAIPRTVNRFFQQYQDRLVYGTDMGTDPEMYRTTFRILESEDEHFYDHNISSYHWSMNGYGLPPEVLEKVYRDNALRILSPPK
ncbi:amidohydrolase [Flavilitoribacter nigricans DSM 23189 = NBRC 102662]|uniref:Amidohydrolase n=2 Tax=Flavilitoribacter TaxID=2762562 RepID=A0A2D0NFF5_FLAN2|nr:amidohydrolase [Flavilitoribacter nigricans DSM 23189 = NBRC 102662]